MGGHGLQVIIYPPPPRYMVVSCACLRMRSMKGKYAYSTCVFRELIGLCLLRVSKENAATDKTAAWTDQWGYCHCSTFLLCSIMYIKILSMENDFNDHIFKSKTNRDSQRICKIFPDPKGYRYHEYGSWIRHSFL